MPLFVNTREEIGEMLSYYNIVDHHKRIKIKIIKQHLGVINEDKLIVNFPLVSKDSKYENHNRPRPTVKLTEKQVSYIKYLITKYSTVRVAKMYKVSQSTVYKIYHGISWKNVEPVIKNPNPVSFSNGRPKINKEDASIPLDKKLSKRQLEVYLLLIRGVKLSDVARKLNIRPSTVGAHRERILMKLSSKVL